MSTKKLLTYEGLEEYNIKWHERLQEMAISDIDINDIAFETLGVDALEIPDEWTISSNGTLNLAASNAYSYWPEGAGTKTVSIVNGTSSELSTFFLKLTDAGNFPMQWGSNIQWKDESEPEWQAFHEDIIYFKSTDGGSTWIGQVVQTNEITPYWKLTVNAQHNDTTGLTYQVPANWGMFFYLPFPSNEFPDDAIINWGDGTIQTNEQFEYDAHVEVSTEMGPEHTGVPKHTYATEGIYHIIIKASTFENIYITPDITGDSFVGDAYFGAGITNITSIDSPLPKLKGSWVGGGSIIATEDDTLEGVFYRYDSLTSIPDKLFYNNSNVKGLNSCLSFTSLQSIPAGLFDKNTAVTSFASCFSRCTSIQSIPSGLFDNNTAVTSFYNCFGECSSLTAIPSGLFDNNTAATNFSYCFDGCSSLTDFTLYIGSSSVSNCSSFITSKANTTRTIYVPTNSTTKTKFDAVASSLGLTILTYTPA